MVVAEFGKGNVLITPSVDGDFEKGCLILQNGKGTGVVGGEKSTENFSASKEDIVLTFENTASVDVVIRNLEKLKKMMNGEVEGCRMIEGSLYE